MAATLNFRFLANDKGLSDGIKRSKKQLSGLERTTKTVASGMKRALGGVGLAIGVSALTSALASAGRAAAADAKSQRLLALQMQTTTKASDKQIASNEKFIGTLSNQVGIVDDELRPAFAKLLRGTGKVKTAQKLLKVALDGSVASGKPLSTVSDALTKAFNGNFTTLYKLAPQLKKTKGGIDEYAASVENAAITGADPFSKLSTVLDNLNEQVGTALLPGFEKLANFFIDNGPAISQFITDLFDPKSKIGKSFQEFGNKLEDLATSVNDFFIQFDPDKKSGVIGFFQAVKTAIDGVITSIEIANNLINLPANAYESGQKTGQNIVDRAAASKVQLPIPSFTGRNTTGQTNYTINVNKATVSAPDIIREIQRLERQTGKKYLATK
jgi:hypothetical protein